MIWREGEGESDEDGKDPRGRRARGQEREDGGKGGVKWTILVVGGSCFVGREVVDALVSEDTRV
eukprot:576913-Amorphochlora_amoeboformis.AAC.1